MASVDDDVDCGQFMLMQTKGFANQTPDAIASNCIANDTRRDRESQPGMRSAIVARKDGEQIVGEAACVSIDAIEFGFLPEAMCRSERPGRMLQVEA